MLFPQLSVFRLKNKSYQPFFKSNNIIKDICCLSHLMIYILFCYQLYEPIRHFEGLFQRITRALVHEQPARDAVGRLECTGAWRHRRKHPTDAGNSGVSTQG